MLCEECGKREATVKVLKVFNGQKSERYLCEECARETGELGFSFSNLFSGLFNFNPAMFFGHSSTPFQQQQDHVCSSCQLSLMQFSQEGRFGCDECYRSFKQQIMPLLRRIHGSTQHNGKIPKRRGNRLRLKHEIRKLRSAMQSAVAAERFEEAAKLRDRIKSLQQKLEREYPQEGRSING